MGNEIKCIHCIEEYLAVPEDAPERVSGEAWSKVREMDTFVPSWQTQMIGPGQMAAACVTVPVCIHHIKIQRQTPEQIATKAGLIIPGQSPN